MKINKNAFMVAGLAAFMSGNAVAAPTIEQGMVMTFQNASDSNAKSEILASYDLVIDNSVGKNGHIIMYVEGSSTSQSDGVSNGDTVGFGEANGDAGSTSNGGQFQVSELFYQHDMGSNFVAVGMMDAGAYFDGGEIANDEGASFISGDLVNNTTIEGPSNYGIGIGGHLEFGSMSVNLFAGGAVGYDGSYTEMLHFQKDTAGNDKGLFTLGELTWATDSTTIRAGFWNNSAKHTEFADTTATDSKNTGIYLLGEQKLGDLIIQGRFGQADKKVSDVATFFSLAGEYSVGPGALGLGYAMSKASQDYKDAGTDRDDRTLIEAFYRYEGGENWTVTPAFTSIKNSGLNSSTAGDRKASVTIMTLRGTYNF